MRIRTPSINKIPQIVSRLNTMVKGLYIDRALQTQIFQARHSIDTTPYKCTVTDVSS